MRRQMQAGVRKKELLERLNAQAPSQGTSTTQAQPEQPNKQIPHPVLPAQQQQQQQQPQQRPPPPEHKPQQQLQPQQQRQFPQRTQQSVNPTLKTGNQGNAIPPSSAAQTPAPRPNVKTRLQMVKGSIQQQQLAGPVKQPQQNQLQPVQQRRNSTLQNVNRSGAPIQTVQVPQRNVPDTRSASPALAQAQGPKLGAKRTVMQRAKSTSFEGQQVPHKVRVVKLTGAVSI